MGATKVSRGKCEQRERNGDVFTERELEGSNTTDEHREKLKNNSAHLSSPLVLFPSLPGKRH